MLKLSLASLLSHFPVEPFCNFYSLSLSLWFIPTHFVIVHFSIEPVFGFSFCSFCPSLLSSLKLAAAVASFFHLFLTKAFAQARDNFRPPLFFLSLIHWVRARANSKGALPESNFETLSRSPKVSSSLDLSLSLVPSIVAARTRNHFHTFYSSALPLEEAQAGPGPFPPSESFYLSLLSSLCLLLLSSAIFHNIKNHP